MSGVRVFTPARVEVPGATYIETTVACIGRYYKWRINFYNVSPGVVGLRWYVKESGGSWATYSESGTQNMVLVQRGGGQRIHYWETYDVSQW